MECPKVVFIGGTGRCGTSVTRLAMSFHPEVATLPFEYRFLIDPDGIIDFMNSSSSTWSPYVADRRLKRLEQFLKKLSGQSFVSRVFGNVIKSVGLTRHGLFTPRQYHGWQLADSIPGFNQAVDELIERLRAFKYSGSWVGTESYVFSPVIYHVPPMDNFELLSIFRKFSESVVASLLETQGRRVYVEDNTWNGLFARELLSLFPESCFVHVYRDPRDVVVSFAGQRWAPADLPTACRWYADLMGRWLSTRKDLDASRYREISMESLVGNPKEVLSGLCELSGLQFDASMLNVEFSSESIGRWRRDISTAEQAQIDTQLAPFVRELGYDK